ncbi:MAG: hypothetical protein ACR2PR_11235 [Pseudohongiellaceae bacterium]
MSDINDIFAPPADMWGKPSSAKTGGVSDLPKKEAAPVSSPSGNKQENVCRGTLEDGASPRDIPAIKFYPHGAPVPSDDVIAALFLLMRGNKGLTDGEASDAGWLDESGEYVRWFLRDEYGEFHHYRMRYLRSRLTTLRHLLHCQWDAPTKILSVSEHGRKGGRGFSRHFLSPRGADELWEWVIRQPGVITPD